MVEETGTSPRSVASTKPLIPCTDGSTPVATVLQITGDDAQLVLSTAREPSRASPRSTGKRSWRQSSSITAQSAPSTPTTISGRAAADSRGERCAHRRAERLVVRASATMSFSTSPNQPR
jgi:hypothetical protein